MRTRAHLARARLFYLLSSGPARQPLDASLKKYGRPRKGRPRFRGKSRMRTKAEEQASAAKGCLGTVHDGRMTAGIIFSKKCGAPKKRTAVKRSRERADVQLARAPSPALPEPTLPAGLGSGRRWKGFLSPRLACRQESAASRLANHERTQPGLVFEGQLGAAPCPRLGRATRKNKCAQSTIRQ